ncbi:hypothetical protein HanIR_Chr10g0499591 [Helianthus annuus]|nr:hypothetical protein HanIR_Chr10g0499591 [Helianthus annuus]
MTGKSRSDPSNRISRSIDLPSLVNRYNSAIHHPSSLAYAKYEVEYFLSPSNLYFRDISLHLLILSGSINLNTRFTLYVISGDNN